MDIEHAENNREQILRVAEKLFAAKGFDATSVNSIAQSAGVNKALIYYYFKNKDDIIHSLFREMIVEMGEKSGESSVPRDDPHAVKEKIAKEIGFLADRKESLALLLMEALKTDNSEDFLFRVMESIISRELNARGFAEEASDEPKSTHFEKALVHEFFTGVIPVFAFILLREKFCTYFNCDAAQVDSYFLEAFQTSHLNSHLESEAEE